MHQNNTLLMIVLTVLHKVYQHNKTIYLFQIHQTQEYF